MCPHCRAFITTKDRVCPYCNEAVGPRAADRREPSAILGGFIPHARFTTVLLVLINVGLYLITSVYSMRAGAGGPSRRSRSRSIGARMLEISSTR